jgi:hypothetical protein
VFLFVLELLETKKKVKVKLGFKNVKFKNTGKRGYGAESKRR